MLKTCLPNFLYVGHCVTALVFIPSFQSTHNPSYTPSTHPSSWQPILPPIQNTDSCKRRRKKKWKKYACFACALKEPCSIITRLPKIKVSLLFWDKVVINPKLSWSTQKFLSTSTKWNDAYSFHIYGGPHHEGKRRKQHSQYFESI